MRKTINKIIVGTLVTGLAFGGAMSTLTLPAAAKAQPTSRINFELPDYEHETEGKMIEEVYDYVEDDIGDLYPEAAVGIPCPIIIDIDESNPKDIRVYGDFEFFTYSLQGDTLVTEAGGSHPGCIHLRKEADGDYEVKKFDQVEDGSKFDESAKKIFGESRYQKFMEEQSNAEYRDEVRNQIVANYVADNNLAITKIQDYGWDPVELPEANTDSFTSFTK